MERFTYFESDSSILVLLIVPNVQACISSIWVKLKPKFNFVIYKFRNRGTFEVLRKKILSCFLQLFMTETGAVVEFEVLAIDMAKVTSVAVSTV